MINMFSHMACICHFVFFYILPRASYVYIQPHQFGFIPSAVWRFFNIFFQLFRCRNLALNRVSSYFLVVGMFLYLGGVVGCPHICMPPVCSYGPLYVCTPPVHLYAPRGVHTPHGPPCSLLLHSFGALHVVGGLFSA